MNHPDITPAQLESFKNRLLTEKAEVEESLKEVGVRNPQNPSDWVATSGDMPEVNADSNELSDRFEEYGQNQGLVNSLEVRLANISRALEKIDNGGYGICEISDAPIEMDRLEANPAARTCKEHMEEGDALQV